MNSDNSIDAKSYICVYFAKAYSLIWKAKYMWVVSENRVPHSIYWLNIMFHPQSCHVRVNLPFQTHPRIICLGHIYPVISDIISPQ